jgi:hypothetical protein
MPKYCRLWSRNTAGAKAHPLFCCICGPTKVVPLLQNRSKLSFSQAVQPMGGVFLHHFAFPRGLKPNFFEQAFVRVKTRTLQTSNFMAGLQKKQASCDLSFFWRRDT